MARTRWTDDRLDDLQRTCEEGFRRVDNDIRALRSDLNARIDQLDAGFAGLNARIDSLQRSMFGAAVVLLAAILGTR